jgi:hypothetical protein
MVLYLAIAAFARSAPEDVAQDGWLLGVAGTADSECMRPVVRHHAGFR